jgi:spore photoproduct lyase
MQKKMENYKKNTFTNLALDYINNNNTNTLMETTTGGVEIQSELLIEKKLLQPALNISEYTNKFIQVKSHKNFPIDKIKDGSIITLFNKTPTPQQPSDVVCPHFYELKWANGCNFNCAWCYLNGTYRFLKGGKKPRLKNIDKVMEHLSLFLTEIKGNYLLNSGELSDSLLFENDGAPLTQKIIPRIMEQDRHKLLILTKSTLVKNLLEMNAQSHVITSFSLNSFKVAETWEKAPKVIERIKAAKLLYDVGYEVRIRIDPMVPIPNWKQSYLSLVRKIFDNFEPERITLGSLRGLSSTINNSKDTTWTKYLTESSNWGKKVNIDKRLEMYSFLIHLLDRKYNYNKIGLCKETIEVWEKLNMDFRKIKCNCLI